MGMMMKNYISDDIVPFHAHMPFFYLYFQTATKCNGSFVESERNSTYTSPKQLQEKCAQFTSHEEPNITLLSYFEQFLTLPRKCILLTPENVNLAMWVDIVCTSFQYGKQWTSKTNKENETNQGRAPGGLLQKEGNLRHPAEARPRMHMSSVCTRTASQPSDVQFSNNKTNGPDSSLIFLRWVAGSQLWNIAVV